jgi:4-hydroxy-3-polyprenylbenzoate decarboxylase
VPFDTLDFTSFTLNLGSKMVLDATRAGHTDAPKPQPVDLAAIAKLHPRIRRARLLEGALLAVQVDGEGRDVVRALVAAPALAGIKLIAAVSPDVNLEDRESLLWGIFTRFDPARDILFTSAELKDAWPVYRGVLGIDATFKSGYPDSVESDPETAHLVSQRWEQYWHA